MPKKKTEKQNGKISLLEVIKEGNYEVVLIAGAGDIELLVEPVKQILKTI